MKLKLVTGLTCVIAVLVIMFLTETNDSAFEGRRHSASYNVLHVDDDGCPEGWTFIEKIYVGMDGGRHDGCVNWRNITSTGKIDVERVEPGETVDMTVGVAHKGEDR